MATTQDLRNITAGLAIRFGVPGDAVEHLGEGWAIPNQDFTWSLGRQSTITFPRLRFQRDCRLTFRAWPLYVPGVLEQQRVVVLVNYRLAGVFAFTEPAERTASLLVPWQMIDGRIMTTITFQFPDARSPKDLGISEDGQTLALAFKNLNVGIADEAAPPDALSPDAELPSDLRELVDREAERTALFRRFESLGHDCEFGMVQRALDIHSLGLLRCAGISADAVATLLQAGLRHVGKRDSLEVEITPDGEMLLYDRASGFVLHTFNYRGHGLEEGALIDREVRRLPRIARKLEEDVEDGKKIFIFKDPADSGPAVARIVTALRTRADNTLLWVRKATPDHPAGLVVPACPGLLLGFVPERPPRDDPDIDCWATVCERAIAYVERPR